MKRLMERKKSCDILNQTGEVAGGGGVCVSEEIGGGGVCGRRLGVGVKTGFLWWHDCGTDDCVGRDTTLGGHQGHKQRRHRAARELLPPSIDVFRRRGHTPPPPPPPFPPPPLLLRPLLHCNALRNVVPFLSQVGFGEGGGGRVGDGERERGRVSWGQP